MRTRRTLNGFSLLELLVVIGIVLIVASIGVVNLSESQARSKVSRAMGDMRSIAVALEAYYGDHGHYPVPYPHIPDRPTNTTGDKLPNVLSSPVPYLQNLDVITDPFAPGGGRPVDQRRYGYGTNEIKGHVLLLPPPQGLDTKTLDTMGAWRMDSVGPDGKSLDWPNEATYDATNGTVSRGDIYRFQANSEGTQY